MHNLIPFIIFVYFLSAFIPYSSFILYFLTKEVESIYSLPAPPPAPMPMLIASKTISITNLKLWFPIEETTVVQTGLGVLAAGYHPQNGLAACCEGRMKYTTRTYNGAFMSVSCIENVPPLLLVFPSNKHISAAHE